MSRLLVVLLGAALASWRRLTRRRRPVRWAGVTGVATLLAIQLLATAPPAAAATCGEPPTAESPGQGLVGLLDPAVGRGTPASTYGDYGYAGLVWHEYTTDCGPLAELYGSMPDVDFLGTGALNAAKSIVGITNSLHYQVMDGSSPIAPLYGAVKSGAEHLYYDLFSPLFTIAALLVVIALAYRIWTGDFRAVAVRGLHTLAGTWLAASSITLLLWIDPIDHMIISTTTDIQAGFADSEHDPAARDDLPTDLHREIVYTNWLAGEFGRTHVPQAETLGPDLLAAQALTKEQARLPDEEIQKLREAKKEEFKRVAGKIGPSNHTFTGEDGSRTGTGFVALGESLIYCSFPIVAKAAILVAQTLLRLLVLALPLLGLLALIRRDTVGGIVRSVGTVIWNVLVLSVQAGIHSLVLRAVFATELGVLPRMAIGLVLTVGLFIFGHPVRRLREIVSVSTRVVFAPRTLLSRAAPGHGPAADSNSEILHEQIRSEATAIPEPRPEPGPRPSTATVGRPRTLGVWTRLLMTMGVGARAFGRRSRSGHSQDDPNQLPLSFVQHSNELEPAHEYAHAGGVGPSGPPPTIPPRPGGGSSDGEDYIQGKGHYKYPLGATDRAKELPARDAKNEFGRRETKTTGFALGHDSEWVVSGPRRGRDQQPSERHIEIFRKTDKWLRELNLPEEVLSAGEIGFLAQHTEIKILAMQIEKNNELPRERRAKELKMVVNQVPCGQKPTDDRGCHYLLEVLAQATNTYVTVYSSWHTGEKYEYTYGKGRSRG